MARGRFRRRSNSLADALKDECLVQGGQEVAQAGALLLVDEYLVQGLETSLGRYAGILGAIVDGVVDVVPKPFRRLPDAPIGLTGNLLS